MKHAHQVVTTSGTRETHGNFPWNQQSWPNQLPFVLTEQHSARSDGARSLGRQLEPSSPAECGDKPISSQSTPRTRPRERIESRCAQWTLPPSVNTAATSISINISSTETKWLQPSQTGTSPKGTAATAVITIAYVPAGETSARRTWDNCVMLNCPSCIGRVP